MMFDPPKIPGQCLQYNYSIFHSCEKCSNGAGQWVTSHQTNTHIDGFRHPCSNPTGSNLSGNKNTPWKQPTILPPPLTANKRVQFANQAADSKLAASEDSHFSPPPPTPQLHLAASLEKIYNIDSLYCYLSLGEPTITSQFCITDAVKI